MKRFWDKVSIADNGCWEWIAGKRNSEAYGSFYFDGKYIGAHRVAYLLEVGEIPEGMCILHKCDNPPCVNPKHLVLGTHQDNAMDREAKGRGRSSRGEKNPKAKITASDVLEIRKLAGTMSQREIGEKYGILQPAIGRIINRKQWSHI